MTMLQAGGDIFPQHFDPNDESTGSHPACMKI